MDDKDEIFKLVCFISDGTISAQDGCHQIKHLIDKKCNEARIDELEKLTDEQMNSQDWERANPGYSVEMVEATKIYDRLAELTKGGNNE
jgi:hypothetical protein